jgi:hypothetical protein
MLRAQSLSAPLGRQASGARKIRHDWPPAASLAFRARLGACVDLAGFCRLDGRLCWYSASSLSNMPVTPGVTSRRWSPRWRYTVARCTPSRSQISEMRTKRSNFGFCTSLDSSPMVIRLPPRNHKIWLRRYWSQSGRCAKAWGMVATPPASPLSLTRCG